MENMVYTPRARVHVCAACSSRYADLRCSRCLVARYCNDECRISNQLPHYPHCYHIRTTFSPGGDLHISFVQYLSSTMGTLDGLGMSIRIFETSFVTDRSVRAPEFIGTMIRVGRDQEAYNLLKVWVIRDLDHQPDAVWAALPWPPAPSSALEDPDFLAGTVPNFTCAVLLLLLKLKMFRDVRNLAIYLASTPGVPTELRLMIQTRLTNSSLSREFMHLDYPNLGPILSTLRRQIKYIGAFINQSGFMPLMHCFFRQIRSYEPKPLLDIALKDVVAVIFETDGVMELLNDAYERAAGAVTGDEILRQVWNALETGGMEA